MAERKEEMASTSCDAAPGMDASAQTVLNARRGGDGWPDVGDVILLGIAGRAEQLALPAVTGRGVVQQPLTVHAGEAGGVIVA